MANEKISYNLRNIGTEESPVLEKWFAITIAEAVRMGADDPTTIKDYVDSKIAALVDSAPEAYNTLKEIADWISRKEKGFLKTTLRMSIKKKSTMLLKVLYIQMRLRQFKHMVVLQLAKHLIMFRSLKCSLKFFIHGLHL